MADIEMRYEKLEARIIMAKGTQCDKYDYFILSCMEDAIWHMK